MKTTIKIDLLRSLVVEPASGGGVCIGGQVATPDQCGALIFAIEAALETQAVKASRCNQNCNQGRNCTCRLAA